MLINFYLSSGDTHSHQIERTELVFDECASDGIVAKLKSGFYVRIRIDLVVTVEIATLSIRHEDVVDYRFNL